MSVFGDVDAAAMSAQDRIFEPVEQTAEEGSGEFKRDPSAKNNGEVVDNKILMDNGEVQAKQDGGNFDCGR